MRLSSKRLRDAMVKGLIAAGCEVTDVGEVPTPLLYYSVQHLGADGGVMITGSHNPAEYNGFKIVAGSGTIHGAAIQELRQMIESSDLDRGSGTSREYDIVSPYVEEISSQFKFNRKVKVVLDAGNGAAGPTMHRVLERLNVDATEIFFEMDGRFPNHHPDPTVEDNLADLQTAVRNSGAELGIAFDGDGDRIGAVDEKGSVVWGDYLLLIYAREILSRKPGSTFIGEVKCSQIMYDEIEKLGGKGIMYKTGHSLIKAKMKEEHAELAGEMSGHMFFKDRYFGFDDAIYAACRLMEIVGNSGQPLSAQTNGLPAHGYDAGDSSRHRGRGQIRCCIPRSGSLPAYPQSCRCGWRAGAFQRRLGLVRASNTQPVLVMRFEAKTPELLKQYRSEVESVVEKVKQQVAARCQFREPNVSVRPASGLTIRPPHTPTPTFINAFNRLYRTA